MGMTVGDTILVSILLWIKRMGQKNMYKRFIDECHARGLAVILMLYIIMPRKHAIC